MSYALEKLGGLQHITVPSKLRVTDVILDRTGGEWYLRKNAIGSDRKLPQYWQIKTTEPEVVRWLNGLVMFSDKANNPLWYAYTRLLPADF